MTLQTYNNDINNGDLVNTDRTRFLFEFFTHNEIELGFDIDVSGYNRAVTDTSSTGISCNGLYRGNIKPLQP